VHPGWNRLRVDLPAVRSLRVTIVGVRQPPQPPRGAGGLDEVRIPGLAVHERLRPPVLATRALAAAGSAATRPSLTYLFDRTSADLPYRTGSVVGDAQVRSRLDRQDPEPLLARAFELPWAARLQPDAWTSIAARAPDDAIDRFSGYRGGARFSSSSRFDGVPGYRASGAFDGDGARGWIGTWLPGKPAWIEWRTARAATVSSLRLRPLAAPVRVVTKVRVSWDGGASPALAVGAGGEVTLPRAVRSRRFRIDVLASEYPAGAPPAERARRAVGIAEVEGAGVPVARMPRSGPARFACGDTRMRIGSQVVSMVPRGSIADLDSGVPMRAQACAADGVQLAAGVNRLDALPGAVRIDHLMLRQPDAKGAWLVLGQSYNRGWRAYCGDHSLGEPVPIDGFANGWMVDRDCPQASFEFAPQRGVQWGYVISGIACLVLLALLLAARVRRRRSSDRVAAPDPWLPEPPAPARLPLLQAAAIAVPPALLLAFLFALRAGPPIWVALTLILWRGVGARALTLVAGALLIVVVPALYVLFPGPDRGGFNPEYAIEHLGAHWVAVAAYVFLAAALGRSLVSTASRASRGRRAARAESGA
jgi:hypothetical protein